MSSDDSGSEENDVETRKNDVGTSKKRKQALKFKGRCTRACLHFEYPHADEMFVDIERELGLGDQEPFYEASGWCRPPPGHPDLAEWLILHESDTGLTQLERKIKEDSS